MPACSKTRGGMARTGCPNFTLREGTALVHLVVLSLRLHRVGTKKRETGKPISPSGGWPLWKGPDATARSFWKGPGRPDSLTADHLGAHDLQSEVRVAPAGVKSDRAGGAWRHPSPPSSGDCRHESACKSNVSTRASKASPKSQALTVLWLIVHRAG